VNLHAPIQLDERTLRDLAHLPPERERADDHEPVGPGER
jgi:hypothetical protein